MTELSGWDWMFASHNYGSRWRRHRKLFRQFFNPKALLPYRHIQERDARRLALCILQEPEGFVEHIRFGLAATLLRVTYGLHVEDPHDEHVTLAEAAVAILIAISVPGKYLVEVFPMFRFLPSWLPGVKFKRQGKAWLPIVRRMRDAPWEHTLNDINDGSAVSSVAFSLIKYMSALKGNEADEADEVSRNVAAVVYAAGADTTISVVQTLFLAMASFPDAQKNAQTELDAIVGPHRLPNLSDRASLPYVAALLMECLRWQVATPFGFPHCSTEDDNFCGYHIPKGTTVIANLWAYARDTKHYPDPEVFMPERFLKDGEIDRDVLDPTTFAFGYGRRSCPGRHFAVDSLFLIATTVLHTLSICAPLDSRGNPVKPEGKMTPGLVSYPEPFDVDIKPRGPWAEALLQECSNAPIIEAS